MRHSRGFTLVEILIALVIMGVVTGALYQMLNNTQRLSRAQAEQVSLESTCAPGPWSCPTSSEKSTPCSVESPRRTTSSSRSRTGSGIARCAGCTLSVSRRQRGTQVQVFTTDIAAYRNPAAAKDGIYVFIEGNPDKEQDDQWIQVPAVTGVAMGTSALAGRRVSPLARRLPPRWSGSRSVRRCGPTR